MERPDLITAQRLLVEHGIFPGDYLRRPCLLYTSTIQDGQAPGTYHVTVCHMLDEFKNEYEIAHREDA